MLTSDLLINRISGELVVPKALLATEPELERATGLIELFSNHHGKTRAELEIALREDEGVETDYRVRRGLAHLLASERSDFHTRAPIEPAKLRERAFEHAAKLRPTLETASRVLLDLAAELSQELGHELRPSEIAASLYADLKEQQVLEFDPPTPSWLIDRYNLAQAQGVLYRAVELVISAHRNDPGEYKSLFRYLKLFGLMHRVTGDADAGFTIVLDGPASLFAPSTRYGLAFAKFLPALLHATRWSLEARILVKDKLRENREARFTLDSTTSLRSHYSVGAAFDSMLEVGFAERFKKPRNGWSLEREVDLVDLGAMIFIPDFRLVHEDGRSILLEIVGYWRPEYLRRKFEKIRRSGRQDLLLAVSSRLKLEDAGVELGDLADQIVWFKGALDPAEVVRAAERLPAGRVLPLG